MSAKSPYVPTEEQSADAIMLGLTQAKKLIKECDDLPLEFCEGLILAGAEEIANMIGGYGAASILRDIADELEDGE